MTPIRPRHGSWTTVVTATIVALALAGCDPTDPAAGPQPPPGQADRGPAHTGHNAAPAPPAGGAGIAPASTPGTPPPGSGSAPVHHRSGVAFDSAKIPRGVPGSAVDRVIHTGELPVPSDIGAFRTVCQYSHMNTDDAIVLPGQPGASHLHVYWGNTAVNAHSTAESIATTGNATCRGGTINRSAYWAPAVIDTGSGTPIAPELVHVYYKSGYRDVRPEQVQPMPNGLRMVAGDAKASGPQEFGHWSCWDGGGGKRATIPRCGVGDSVVMTLEFPQCWDGRNLDSADHRSHMAYAEPGHGCPGSHPVGLPVITYNVLYPVTATTDTARWRLSSDTYDATLPGGFSVHGDWWDGWKADIKRTWITGCVNRPVTCHSNLLGDGRHMEGDV